MSHSSTAQDPTPGLLKIGVEQRMFDLPPQTGYGRVWTETLHCLGRIADLTVGNVNPDVWLLDGHNYLPDVEGPMLVHVIEVSWETPSVGDDLAAAFVDRIADLTEKAVSRADQIVVPSESTKRQVVEAYGYPEDDIRMAPYGVDLDVFTPERKRELPADFLGGRPYILFVSSLHPRKNLRAVRAAVANLASKGFPHALVLVTSPAPDREDSSQLSAEAISELPGFPGRVFDASGVSDAGLAALMAGADVFCQPSFAEGFGMSVLEAMASGAPVVVSDRGSLPEVVGEAGIVVEPTTAGVEAGLLGVLSDPVFAGSLRLRSRQRAEQMTWEVSAVGWLEAAERAAVRWSSGVGSHDRVTIT